MLKDGSRIDGNVTMCDEEYCFISSKQVMMEEIAHIELISGVTAPAGAKAGAIIFSDGRVHGARFTGLSLGVVATENGELSRGRVAIIVVADAPQEAVTPTITPTITPRVLPSAPPVLQPADRAPEGRASLLLSEVRFLPDKKAPQFVELVNRADEPVRLAGWALRNEKGQTIEFPREGEVSAGGFFVQLLEDRRDFLAVATGGVSLIHDGTAVDTVAWGSDRPSFVRLCRGGLCSPPEPGSVIARLPGAVHPSAAWEWALLDPEQATPGAVNKRPRVAMFAAVEGLIYPGRPRFSWYGVAGAARYRLQVAKDSLFKDIVSEVNVAATESWALVQEAHDGPDLPRGDYFWRVQAISADSEVAEFSRAMPFRVDPTLRPRARGARSSSAHRADFVVVRWPPALEAQAPPPAWDDHDLGVPALGQRKDTAMLMLEPLSENNPRGWDKPDPDSVRPYCARAAVADVVAYYGGHLSQDRIAYEVFKGRDPGPELDLPESGMQAGEITKALKFALGANVTLHTSPGTRNREQALRWGSDMVRNIKQEIDAGRPLVAGRSGHVFLIPGYVVYGEQFYYIYQDEQSFGYHFVDAEAEVLSRTLVAYWTGLANVKLATDEREIDSDADGDGIVDFDERRRFGTKPSDPDSDGDGVHDKEEVRASVFDTDYGYARSLKDHLARLATGRMEVPEIARLVKHDARDKDGDGKAMELDPDSDGGGCKDGDEDLNVNGKRESSESSNFVRSDDVVDEHGECGKIWTGTIEGEHKPGNDHLIKISVQVRLREVKHEPVRVAEVGATAQIIQLFSVGSFVTVTHSTVGSSRCAISGEGSSPANGIAGEIIWTVESVDAQGRRRLSKPVYNLSITPDNDIPWNEVCQREGLPPQSWTHSGLGWGVHFGDAYPDDGQVRTLDGGRMQGRYTYEMGGATWNICRGGGDCVPPPEPRP